MTFLSETCPIFHSLWTCALIFNFCRIIQSAGQDGINKLVTTFLSSHENVSKRQAEIKINELAVKEKRPEDKYIIWHIRPEFERYLHMSSSDAMSASSSSSSSSSSGAADVGSSAKKRKNDDTEDAGEAAGSGGAKEPRRYKRAFGFFVKSKRAEAEAQLGTSASVSRLGLFFISHYTLHFIHFMQSSK